MFIRNDKPLYFTVANNNLFLEVLDPVHYFNKNFALNALMAMLNFGIVAKIANFDEVNIGTFLKSMFQFGPIVSENIIDIINNGYK